MSVELRTVRLTDPVLAPLLSGLAAEYEARYGANDELADAPPEQFDPPDGVFLALVVDGELAAGGGIRRYDADTCEVKRMWTAPRHRRRGHARRVLAALEDCARDLGYTRLLLETGPAQPEAIAMYHDLGYQRIPYYGRYEFALAFERRLCATI